MQTSFLAGDLSFETAILLGVDGGRVAGIMGGALLGLPALLYGEWATLPFMVMCGFLAGQLRKSRAGTRRHLVVFPIHRPEHLPLAAAQRAEASPL